MRGYSGALPRREQAVYAAAILRRNTIGGRAEGSAPSQRAPPRGAAQSGHATDGRRCGGPGVAVPEFVAAAAGLRYGRGLRPEDAGPPGPVGCGR
jgi:hypothetical protein